MVAPGAGCPTARFAPLPPEKPYWGHQIASIWPDSAVDAVATRTGRLNRAVAPSRVIGGRSNPGDCRVLRPFDRGRGWKHADRWLVKRFPRPPDGLGRRFVLFKSPGWADSALAREMWDG